MKCIEPSSHWRYLPESCIHEDVIKWKHFPRYWPFVRGIHRLPLNSPHKGQWHGALMFSFVCVWINGWVNNRGACNLKRHRAPYDIIVMASIDILSFHLSQILHRSLPANLLRITDILCPSYNTNILIISGMAISHYWKLSVYLIYSDPICRRVVLSSA